MVIDYFGFTLNYLMMSFFELHYMGGLEFMVPLSLMALAILLIALLQGYALFYLASPPLPLLKQRLEWVIYLGSFAFFWGILGHAIGIYAALDAIEKVGNVSPAMLAGGLKVSMIVPLYGLLIFILSSMLWFFLRNRYQQMMLKAS